MINEVVLTIHLYKTDDGHNVVFDMKGQLTLEGLTTLSEAFSLFEETLNKEV